jgi:predicted dehydrogenase
VFECEDSELTKKMASYGEIKNIETSPESLVSNSDIVFVITRRPEKHLEYAKFAINQKKPLFVEKPATQTINEAKTLINLVRKSNIIMTSFSTLRFSSDTTNHIKQLNQIGNLTFANYLGPASKYKSLLFYGIHIIELMLHIHGDEIESINAIEHPKNDVESNVQALCKYNDGSLDSTSFLGCSIALIDSISSP